MSQVFPKNKEKRSRPSNEANTSFVKHVTSRVSGLLPSTITKWFSSPSTSNANGSSSRADASDSSDDETDTPVITQPPAKRMRFNSPGTYGHYGHGEAGCSTDVEIMELPYGASPFIGPQYAQPSRNTFTTPLRPPIEDLEPMDRDTPHMFKMHHSVSSIGQSITNKRKSIFDTTSPEECVRAIAKSARNTMPDPKQPSFKPSLLGSPFYPGRTMYGGAATSSYINQPNIKQQSVAVVNESKSNSDDTALSSSARRIMDLLESYSSPLMEARRIPLYTKPKNDWFNNTSSDRPSPYKNRSISYKTQELHVPSIASILRLKKKSRLMDTTNAARQLIASHSSASSFPTYPTEAKGKEPDMEQPHKMTTKVKARVTRTNRGIVDQYEAATPVKLPTAVLQLNEDKLPHFSFDTPPVTKLPATSTPKIVLPTVDKNVTAVSKRKHETVTKSVFKFSNPVTVSNDTPPEACASPPQFTFKSPELRIDQEFESKCDDCSVVVGIVKEPEISTTKPKDWACADCWVKNKSEATKCVCCGSKQPMPNAKCSVCKLADSLSQKDKCANCEKMFVSQVDSPHKTNSIGISSSSKWKCEVCWVSNEDSATKCVCCSGIRPRSMSSAPDTGTATSLTSTITPQTSTAIFKPVPVPATAMVDADWKCDDCWISNKSSVDKCAACGGARPGAKQTSAADATPNTNSFFGTSDDQFKNIIKPQKSGKWECSSCLVRNESEKDKCVCCGADNENKKKTPDLKFNFGKTANSSFKFGIDPKVQEATITKTPEIFSTLNSKFKTLSETNNNILSETPTFTFTLPKKTVENKTDDCTEKSVEAPKMNFTFGIPKHIPASTVFTNKLEFNNDLEEEKLQEVPSVHLNAPMQSKPLIISPLTQVNQENRIFTPGTLLLNPLLATDAKKDTPLNSVDLPGTSSAEKPKPPTFSFGVSSNTKLFETPASTSTSMNLFTQQSQTTTLPTTSAPTFSMFKSPETITPTTSAPTFSMFNSSETITPTTSAPTFSMFNSSETITPTTSAPTFSMFKSSETITPTTSAPTFSMFNSSETITPTTSAPTFSMFKSPETITPTTSAPTFSMFKSSETITLTTSAPTFSMFKSSETSTPTTSLFQQPDVTTKPALMFQNSESTNNAAPAPMFSFGNNAPSNPTPPAALTLPAAPEKPKFAFTFGNNPTPKTDPPALFQSPFGVTESSNANTSTFSLPSGTTLGANNNLPTTLGGSNGLIASNGLTGNTMAVNSLGSMAGNSLSSSTITIGNAGTLGGTNGLSANPLSAASSMQPGNSITTAAPSLFSNTGQENVWPASSSTPTPNPFVSNSATSSLQKPTFTFGSSTPFNAASSTPTFGTPSTPQNMFGMNSQPNNTQSSMFANTVPTQPTGNLFGSPQPQASNPTPQMPMFGTSSIGATPTFGSPNPTIPSFESPAPAPAFNFGAPQSTGIFGFGQQQQLQQQQIQQQHIQQQQQQLQQHQASPQQTGVYSFGGAPAGAPQVQFSMGSGANPAVRRVRKAVRRNPQR